jgi:two-component system phosphate regulon sensor histidine kinase PhoR
MADGIDPDRRLKRLRLLLGLLFLGLAVPAGFLIRQGFVQIELAEFRRQQLIAEDLVRSIDARLAAAIAVEEARPASDFDYATTAGNGNVVQLSPLSSLAAANAFPGTIGYFQVDTTGQLSTPLLPESIEEVPATDIQAKLVVENALADALEANQLVEFRRGDRASESATAEAEPRRAQFDAGSSNDTAPVGIRGQAAFDELARQERLTVVPAAESVEPDRDENDTAVSAPEESRASVQVSTFAGELEPLRFSQLETGHLVLFRNAWRDGERFVQGMLIDREMFIDDAARQAFVSAGLAPGTRATITVGGRSIVSLDADSAGRYGRVDGSALYATRLSPPLADIEIAFSSGVLGRGPGFNLLTWTAIALFGVLVGGFFAMYRFGIQQLKLARQQQNFVSAVSHELKTPLTSIRMYGEMLRSGWADDNKKQVYYDYIFDEGERLSRLIDNVLQLARLNRSEPALSMEPIAVGELVDVLRSKLSTQVERAGFELDIAVDPTLDDAFLSADIDALTQVFINLVDNAIKFSGDSETRKVSVTARPMDKRRMVFTVRDFGPGIPPAEMKRLFGLFYRPDNELTRTTAGTGIGLALVSQLVTSMRGRVDVVNREPGAEFRLEFPLADNA